MSVFPRYSSTIACVRGRLTNETGAGQANKEGDGNAVEGETGPELGRERREL